jgi:G:T-mismatch repair DNA endonuclease (very short patch repair protein)
VAQPKPRPQSDPNRSRKGQGTLVPGTHNHVRLPNASDWELATRALVAAAGLPVVTTREFRTFQRSNGQWNWHSADLYFDDANLAVFLDGCYWHECPDHGSGRHADRRTRDTRVNAALAERGIRVLRIWEHDGPESAAQQIRAQARADRDGVKVSAVVRAALEEYVEEA